MERVELLTANLRHIYGDARTHKDSNVPCSDYVSEQKLIRIFKQSINSDIIEQLRGIRSLGAREDTIKQNLIEIVEQKINKLDGKEIRNYIERFEENDVLTCIREIIGRQEEDEGNN
tara:strand:- start:470 stop:820 length:351 start_codon:yes stop_codon:yes gene_type:complete